MGANHKKEVNFFCATLLIRYGYITNFGKKAFGGFFGIEV
jgi:hypothetical protein